MSYDISLLNPVTKEPLNTEFNHEMTGGTYAIGGATELWLNVTYNYSRWFVKDGVFPQQGKVKGIRTIDGISGAESIPILRKAILALESMTEDISDLERDEYERNDVTGYWMPTRQNAIKPLYQLLAMAQIRPDGVWEVC